MIDDFKPETKQADKLGNSFMTRSSVDALLKSEGIDITDKDYKKHPNYAKIKDGRIFGIKGSITIEQYIEKNMLPYDALHTYESIYDMGNPDKLPADCSYLDLAYEIIEVMEFDGIKDEVDISNLFTRKGGIIERIKKFLNLDLKLFDEKNLILKSENEKLRYKAEICKILYLFYMLDNKYFPNDRVLELLKYPSMENVDNSFFNWTTSNGKIIGIIKDALEKELIVKQNHLMPMQRIKDSVYCTLLDWQNFLNKSLSTMNDLTACNDKYDFKKRIDVFVELMSQPQTIFTKKMYFHSPIETLYLKILQHEQIGRIKDIVFINSVQEEIDYNVPPDVVAEMKLLHKNPVIDIEKHIIENSLRFAKHIYFNESKQGANSRRIRENAYKVLKVWGFCVHARFDIDVEKECTELWVVSCLQTILEDVSNEIFNYTFHGEQKQSSSKQRFQAVLKSDKLAYDALQEYWNRKVNDRWYANIGKYDLRIKFREVENVCDKIMMEILTYPDVYDMIDIHKRYFKGTELFFKICDPRIPGVKIIDYLPS